MYYGEIMFYTFHQWCGPFAAMFEISFLFINFYLWQQRKETNRGKRSLESIVGVFKWCSIITHNDLKKLNFDYLFTASPNLSR